MQRLRLIEKIVEPQPVLEGAGVLVNRTIATRMLNYLDPFLLLDHFESDRRELYEAGFPMHPHRGIETVTYVLSGCVHHQDTLGNAGDIGPGDAQWMTSGRGIMHEEMPQVRPEGISGFQLWVNLPAKLKMTQPQYQDIRSAQIAETETEEGARVRVVAGSFGNVTGPVTGIPVDPTYLDVAVPPRTIFTRAIPQGYTAFAYVFEGEANFAVDGPGSGVRIAHTRLVIFGDGDFIRVVTDEGSIRLLLISGKPLYEPVARYGPFVMNTKDEIEQALLDLRRGTFVS